MKKTSKYLLMFVGAFITMICGIQNVFASTMNMDFTGYYYERSDNGANYSSWKLQNYYVDGNVAYCIEPGIPEGNPMIPGGWENTGLSNSIKQRILLISYYGYQYTGHQTQGYRAATQALIWETILGGNTKVTFSTARYGQGTPYNVDYEKSVIENLVAHHTDKPSFNGTSITSQVGTPVTLTDTNNVLSNYEVYASNGAEISINGNNLTITPTEIGNVNLKFVKKQIYNRSYLIYYGDGIQNMLSGGNVDPVTFSVNLTGLGGKVEFVKHDMDTNKNVALGVESTLKGAVYGIYDDSDNLIQKLTTDENGYSISGYLPYFGNYYLKEITPSKGYQLDPTKYYFTSSKDDMLTYVKTYEKIINRDIELTKVYADDKTGIMTPELDIEFGFYDSKGNLYTTGKTDKNGRIKVNLIYGTYTVKQLNTSKDHEKVEDFTITVSEVGDTFYYTLANAEITAKLKVVKVDSTTGNIITRSNIKFKIFNVDTGEYVKQTITYPTATTIEVFETDSNGILITPYPLKSGTYRLEEVDQVIDGYLWNKESVEFHIGENSELINDNKYGILFEVKFENTPVKGSVEITKTGEEVELTDNGFVYKKINLKGVKIGLYASENIYDALGNLIYKKGTLVKELITDENGYIKVNDLYLGKYYLQELETVNNHVLDNKKYEFELKYKDQYTPVIEYKTTLENYLPKSTLVFTKEDLVTSEPLPDTLIEIYTDEEIPRLVFSGRTDNSGKIVIDNLPIGKYFIIEKEAPQGYQINPDKMCFQITENGQVIKSTMKDEIVPVPNTGLSNIDYELVGCIALALTGLGFVLYEKKKNKKK